jgi:hypothetical protein
MIKRNIIKQFIAVIFVAYYSCTPEVPTPVFRDSTTADILPVENPPFIGLPISLEYYDGRLYISDFYGDTLITVFDVGSSQIISKGITKGEGPKEALSPLNLFLSGDTLFLVNRRAFSMGYDIPDTLNEQKFLSFNKLCSFPSDISNLTGIDGKYLASGYFDRRYAVFNSRGEKETEFGDYPSFLFGEKDFPVSAKAMFHQIRFTVNRNLRKVACVSAHVLDIVEFSPSPNIARRILLDPYSYKFVAGNTIYTEQTHDTSRGTRAVCSTDNYIYILFDSAVMPVKSDSNTAPEIWCFDWNGEAVKKIFVNQGIEQLTAINDTFFYSMSHPEYELVKLSFAEDRNDR